MKKIIPLFLSVAVLAFMSITPASAATGFEAGRIIDDGVFTNKSTMSVADIQTFLNSKVPSCDTNGQQLSEFGGPDLNGDGKVQRWEWGKQSYNQTTFPCLKDYIQDGVSAAQLIYNASQTYSINPQVIIVLLQKEQGLITDTWPLNLQYRSATGYGCPDTAACDSKYYGLKNQLNWAATMFRAIINDSPTWYTPYVLGNNYIQYSPDASCGGSTVNIQNRATQAMYNYTPYQPSQAALDAGWGQVNCGAYGNRNFYLYFTSWFGSTRGGPAYQWSLESFNIYSDPEMTQKINDQAKITLEPGQKAYVRVEARNTGASAWTENTFFETTNSPILGASSWIKYNTPAGLSQYPIEYNSIGTYVFTIQSPIEPGYYSQTFNLHYAGSIWFNDQNARINIDSVPRLTPPIVTDLNRLSPGQTLQQGEMIYSPEKHSVLYLRNGQLALYINFKKVWGTNIPNSKATKLVNQPDGNLVLYSANNEALWASNTDGAGASTLSLQSDGNLVLYSSGKSVWSTETNSGDQLARVNASIRPDQTMLLRQQLSTPDRKSFLVLQQDGNLVLYNPQKQAIWASNTDGKNVVKLNMQPDGNLVLYTADNKAIWASNTDTGIQSFLTIQQDRNIVLYRENGSIGWTTNTAGR